MEGCLDLGGGSVLAQLSGERPCCSLLPASAPPQESRMVLDFGEGKEGAGSLGDLPQIGPLLVRLLARTHHLSRPTEPIASIVSLLPGVGLPPGRFRMGWRWYSNVGW
ncbi:UNVERIFIED_CONTAM: hypothetical protein Slati_0429700 [Sesamum latifolium]|uniref:Uncharacterized protein n=1 Tax=Sesamum latifolium TaxID=2727402 RepID=A0AAW2Y0A3_9LAMI